jgi:hypothetical protein
LSLATGQTLPGTVVMDALSNDVSPILIFSVTSPSLVGDFSILESISTMVAQWGELVTNWAGT